MGYGYEGSVKFFERVLIDAEQPGTWRLVLQDPGKWH